MKAVPTFLSALAGALSLVGGAEAVIVVNSFDPLPAIPAPGAWYQSDMRGAGTASTPDLTGAGGNLEFSQPLPTGAGMLTTGFDNGDKAEVGTFGAFGNANAALTGGTFGYSYYKQTVAGGNAFAAPSLKISILGANHGPGNDSFGTLIYEPNWNQGTGGSALVPADAWQDVSISASTGAGGTGGEGWWWTGGFDQPSGGGGPPIRSLDEWAALFSADPDFATAEIVGISVGVGTYNQGQVGYFDNVSIAIPGGFNDTFDIQAIPEPTAALFGVLLTSGMGLTIGRRRRDAAEDAETLA